MKLLTKRETAARIGVSMPCLDRMRREGRFPQPIRLGPTKSYAVRFVEDDVNAWLEARRAEARRPAQNTVAAA